MKLSSLLAILGVATTATAYMPTDLPRNAQEFRAKHPLAKRADSACRRRFTPRASTHDLDDVSAEFEQAVRDANNGGTVYLPKDELFVIGKPLDLTFLNDIHVKLEGTIKFTNDTPYWQANAFYHPFQRSLMFWKWGGKDIKIYGEGVLDGNGQRWWNEFSGLEILDPDNPYLRPVLFYAENTTNLHVEGIFMKDSPVWHNFVVTSKDVTYKDVIIEAISNNATSPPKNSDFFNSLNVDGVTVERVWVNIGDDCFSPKSNTSNIHVNTMYCNGTHGQSMGSLGQYEGEVSFVENVLIENVALLNGDNGARLKIWAGESVGSGWIRNVTFRNFYAANLDFVARLDSCYFNIPSETCNRFPSKMSIQDITFENFTGSTSGKNGDAVARLTCSTSPDAVCENVVFKNFNVTSPCGGAPVVICDGITGLQHGCVAYDSPEAKAALANSCKAPVASIEPPWPVRDWRNSK
ncbi:uncharacterized protein PgNI_07328 [Pyricularia grisea]|uniref:galacturonan 1,4-alpha-galacturonidase n=1 Tax=Pyricularia grisea TaxID=148305 RepID=A0A6P8B2Y6_PYRGI|nr:uncharacterized protein PgNI_07328 [Pyricularia grisea]TLD09068.1 hypothetical protein PgNI_07328 [Pyricularia grisea]